MKYRVHDGVSISEVGIGCYALGGAYGRKDVNEFRRMIVRAHELGVNYFDAADAYGDAEVVLGKAVKRFREEVLIATKVGVAGGMGPDLSAGHVKAACERSLGRLQTDYIDIYQVHFDDPDIPVRETVGALKELVSEGKIRRYGIGHLPAERVEEYLGHGEAFSVLMELSAVARASRTDLLPLCRRFGAAAVAFSVTGRGILSGKIDEKTRFEEGDIRNIDPLFQRENLQSGLRVASKLAVIAKRYGKTPAQAAVAWVLSQPGVVCALTGPSTVAHLEENLGGSGWSFRIEDSHAFETFLSQEDKRLRRERNASIDRILDHPLPEEPEQAFKDLVYAAETATLVGRLQETAAEEFFIALMMIRDALDEVATPDLEKMKTSLRNLVGPAT